MEKETNGNSKTITITDEDARNLIFLIQSKYDPVTRHNPRFFIQKTKGKAISYYRLLETYAALGKKQKENKNESA